MTQKKPLSSELPYKIHCNYDTLEAVSSLQPHPKNRNIHPVEQIERLAKILEYQGWRAPIVVSSQSEKIVKGHGTLQAAIKNGWSKVPVVFQDFDSEDQEYAFVQSDNAISDWSYVDLKGVNVDLAELDGMEFDLDLLGLRDFDLNPGDKEGEVDKEKKKVEFEAKDSGETEYIVVVRCKDEMHQSALYDELKGRGYTVDLMD